MFTWYGRKRRILISFIIFDVKYVTLSYTNVKDQVVHNVNGLEEVDSDSQEKKKKTNKKGPDKKGRNQIDEYMDK